MEDENLKISSKHLRKLIKDGEIAKANKFLGRNYKLRGEVIHGKKRGRLLNFPTANLGLNFSYVIPTDGVYMSKTNIGSKSYYSLTNVGSNPTFETSQEKKIETYIYDFKENLYGDKISVEFIEFFRKDFKFDSADELISQMDKDKARGLAYIEKHLS